VKLACCWLYAISLYGYPPSLEDTLTAIRRMHGLGFTAIELEGVRRDNMLQVGERRREIRALCDDLGLRIINFCPILPDIVSPDGRARREALDLFKLGVEIARDFGCETVQTDSYTPPLRFLSDQPYSTAIEFGKQFRVQVDPQFDWNRLWATVVESVRACADLMEGSGMMLTLEPRVGEIVANTDALLRLMDAVGSPLFGAVLDAAHLHAQKEILPLSVEKLGSRIRFVHAADNDGRDNEHLAPGRGQVDWAGVLLALQKHRYAGYIGLDIGGVPDLDAQYREGAVFLADVGRKVGVPLSWPERITALGAGGRP
jgi:sugar phosphate isomerase/epimerase